MAQGIIKERTLRKQQPPGGTASESSFPASWMRLTESDLPYSDGIPLDSQRQLLAIDLLIHTLLLNWAKQHHAFVGGNMFVYFSPKQTKTEDFRGPDVFIAKNVESRERKSWLVWKEGKPPDVVIELISEEPTSEILDETMRREAQADLDKLKGRRRGRKRQEERESDRDRVQKKRIYQDKLKAPEYIWYELFGSEMQGFVLREGVYEPMPRDEQGRLISEQMGLALVRWQGEYGGLTAPWLRWATLEGELLPTPEELAEQEKQRAEQEKQRADQIESKLGEERRRAERMAALLKSMGVDADQL